MPEHSWVCPNCDERNPPLTEVCRNCYALPNSDVVPTETTISPKSFKSFLTYAGYTALGLLFSFMGFVFAMTGGTDAAYLTGGALLIAYVGAISFVVTKAKAGKGPQSAFVLALPMPLVSAIQAVFLIGSQAVSFRVPDSEAFTSVCKTAGVQFFAAPSSPVRSVAYLRESKYSPPFTVFKVTNGTRITSLSFSDPPHPSQIQFVESGPNTVGAPYFHTTHSGQQQGVSSISADAVVSYRLSPEDELQKAPTQQGAIKYEVTVIDRRVGQTLASLTYVIDAKSGRACGLTGKDVMDLRSFVLQAIGLR